MKIWIFLPIFVVSAVKFNYTSLIRGTLSCESKRAGNLELELMESDPVTGDDKLNQTKTDKNGEFEIFGFEEESKYDPYLLIKHKCNVKDVKNKKCYRKSRYDIYQKEIHQEFELPFLSLDIYTKKDEEICD
ncbi:unnamed protein product [Caenorhabditis angaria]|uniref:Uncharacterized protein n=1 Tax=Caenorhabditis angaria TaxID=860376 RepID=A0A9P1N1J4_9PELO|nr:unnamed protein product [Caenorhabditis angaria]